MKFGRFQLVFTFSFLLLFISLPSSHAVKSYENMMFGAHFGGGAVYINYDSFGGMEASTMTATTVSKKVGGFIDLGLIASLMKWVSISADFHFTYAPTKTGILVSDNSGLIAGVKTKLNAMTPMVILDIYFASNPNIRTGIGLGAGYAYVQAENVIEMASYGTSLGYENLSTKYAGWSPMYSAHFKLEFMMPKNLAINVVLGYKYCLAKDLRNKAGHTSFLGFVTHNDVMTTNSGDAKKIDLSHFFAGGHLVYYF